MTDSRQTLADAWNDKVNHSDFRKLPNLAEAIIFLLYRGHNYAAIERDGVPITPLRLQQTLGARGPGNQ